MHDRKRRTTKPTKKFGYADFIIYASIAAKDIYCSEPKSFHKAPQFRKLNLCGRTTKGFKKSTMAKVDNRDRRF